MRPPGISRRGRPRRDAIQAELERFTGEIQHLAHCVAEGSDSPAIRAELQTREGRRDALRQAVGREVPAPEVRYPEVRPTGVLARLHRLDQLIQTDPLDQGRVGQAP